MRIYYIFRHLNAAIPLNKQLYTLSYVCVTAGAGALVFSIFYSLVIEAFAFVPIHLQNYESVHPLWLLQKLYPVKNSEY